MFKAKCSKLNVESKLGEIRCHKVVPVISRVGRRTWGRSLFHENERNYQERSKNNGTITEQLS